MYIFNEAMRILGKARDDYCNCRCNSNEEQPNKDGRQRAKAVGEDLLCLSERTTPADRGDADQGVTGMSGDLGIQ